MLTEPPYQILLFFSTAPTLKDQRIKTCQHERSCLQKLEAIRTTAPYAANHLRTNSPLHVDNKDVCGKKDLYLLHDFLWHSKQEAWDTWLTSRSIILQQSAAQVPLSDGTHKTTTPKAILWISDILPHIRTNETDL